MPPEVIWWCPMTKICILCGPKMPKNGGKKICKKPQKFCLPQMPRKLFSGTPVTEMCIFWGPNTLPHATTNTAAYKCICLFCNTFLPSGKAVLVLLANAIVDSPRHHWYHLEREEVAVYIITVTTRGFLLYFT